MPVPDREPEVGLGEGGPVVDAVPHHRDRLAAVLQATHFERLVGRKNVGHDPLDPDGGRDLSCALLPVTGEQDGRQAELSQLRRPPRRSSA